MSISLGWLPQAAFAYMLIFARVGTMLMLIPALGEQAVPTRMRLSFALAFALVLFPLLQAALPAIPAELPGMIGLLFHELLIGLILGGMLRLTLMATQVAGSIIAFQTGLSVAMAADPSQQGVQGAVIGSFLSFLAITLIFATDLHHMALSAIYDSYRVFAPSGPLMLDDATQLVLRVVSEAFVIGVQMAGPFIVFGLVFNVGVGILSKLMPQLQVYFMAMPATVGIGLILVALLLTMMMGWYLTHFEAQLALLRS